MNRWASQHPELMAEIASLPLSQQNAAMRGAVGDGPSWCERCNGDGFVLVPGYSVNPSSGIKVRDPQCDGEEHCPVCGGSGEAPS